MNNQEIKSDAGKLRLTLVPLEIIRNIASIREFGVKKYGKKESWKSVEVERYRDALFRHTLLYFEDPYGVDEESGLPHLWHLACNVAFLCELEKDKYNKGDVKILAHTTDGDVLDLSRFKEIHLKESEDVSKLKNILEHQDMSQQIISPIDADGFNWEKGEYVSSDDERKDV